MAYFRAGDDSLRNGNRLNQSIAFDYLDDGPGVVEIKYDAVDGAWASAGLVEMKGSGQWRRAVVELDDAWFAGRCNGADIRLEAARDVYFSGVYAITNGKASVSMNTGTVTGINIGWNDAVWGDPAAVPTAGNDYIYNKSGVWLNALGTTYGSFAGDSLTIQTGSGLFGRGSGSLGGTLILDGGQYQNRASGTSVILGNIQVVSTSSFLSISGNLELQTGLSGAGDLKVGAHTTTGLNVLFNGADNGYTGDFILANSAADNVSYAVQFNQSYAQAGLTFEGGNLLRTPVYQLKNDIPFLSVSMPSATNSSVLIELAAGTYDAAGLSAAGVHSAYYTDLGGTITVQDSPRYFSLHTGWSMNNPSSITQAGFDQILDSIGGSKGAPYLRVATAVTVSYLQGSIASQQESILRILALAVSNDFPVILHLDGVNWWAQRPDLWNWWDPAMEGYDPANVYNVEWSDWGANNAVKLGWRNWGTQIRVSPKPNLASPEVLAAHKEAVGVLAPVIAEWYDNLPPDKKYLLGGVVLGWELATSVNAYFYPNGNDYLGQDPVNDPTGGAAAAMPLGYAAATILGLQGTTGVITRTSQAAICKNYFEEIIGIALECGVPSRKIITHAFDNDDIESGAGALVDGVYDAGIVPGWSSYGSRDPSTFDPLLNEIDGRPWAAIEFQPDNLSKSYINSFFQYRNCRYVNIFNWESIENDAAVTEMIGSLFSDFRLSGNLEFSGVQERHAATNQLALINKGMTPVAVSSIAYPDGFTGTPFSGTIAAGQTQMLSVVFTPDAAREFEGRITVNSDARGGPHIHSCRGTATPAPRVLIRLEDLVQTFTGSALQPSVTTDPANIAVNLMFNGSAVAPFDIGEYEVVAEVVDPGFNGKDIRTFTILSPRGVPRSWFDRFGIAPLEGETWQDVEGLILPGKTLPVWKEYVSGVDPTGSEFKIVSLEFGSNNNVTLEWMGGLYGPVTPYVVQVATNLSGHWVNLGQQLRVQGTNRWSGSLSGGLGAENNLFFRIIAESDMDSIWSASDFIPINSATPTGVNVDWNSEVWGDPVSAVQAGRHYVHNKSGVWLRALGDIYGSFEGSSLTMKIGAALFVSGSGDLGGTLILDGGQLQIRAAGTSVILGNIQVVSTSAVLSITGNLELQTGLSGAGDLNVGASKTAGLSLLFNGADNGYTGDFILANSGADNLSYAVQFNRSYTNAGLTFEGGTLLRAPVYQLTNDISFLSVKMPSAANSSVLIELAEGTYDADALVAAGINSAYFNDLGGTLTVIPEPATVGMLGLGAVLVLAVRRGITR